MMMRAFRFTAVAALAVLAAGCVSQSRQVAPQVSPQAKRIVSDGAGGYVLPDGTRVQVDPAGGFTLPNGAYVRRDASGALNLPNGSRCVPDSRSSFACP
ncbi:MAG TPA: hypothetical protein VGO06_25995 [Bosea sp. (in: a-proteobacteria)]|jgi:hypothetical protein|uniref:hypothetical protein n=1 Tax=Bosea sp. (in: a-proteobacteria) TaxID=1871050 RepID=UPI002E157C2F|nr:hypothetical protein [Bosea sp. (in: a-proteobacteria)]